ncbi:B3 domain-containing protein [Arabidopsis thaliana]
MTTNDDDHAAERNTMSMNYELAATLSDEEQRARKGKAKIVCKEEDHVFIKKKEKYEEESEKREFFSHVPRKIRPALRYPQPNFENPNGASSSLNLPFEEDYYMAEYYKKTETINLPNPYHQWSPSSFLTEYTHPRMREYLRTAREMRWWLRQVKRDMRAEDLTLILEKSLSTTDVNTTTHGRFSMPFNRLISNDFLKPEERSILQEDSYNDETMGVEAILVDQRSQKWGVILKRWGLNYFLSCGWNDVVKANELEAGHDICVWAFRCDGVLCFAMRQYSSYFR